MKLLLLVVRIVLCEEPQIYVVLALNVQKKDDLIAAYF